MYFKQSLHKYDDLYEHIGVIVFAFNICYIFIHFFKELLIKKIASFSGACDSLMRTVFLKTIVKTFWCEFLVIANVQF